MVCICTTLLLAIPFPSLAVSPKPLVPEYQKIALTANGDPDGPTEGGLDDISDWGNLLSFIGNLLLIPSGLITLSYVISVQKGLISFLWNLLILYFFVYGVFAGFTDAFDLRDPDKDGR